MVVGLGLGLGGQGLHSESREAPGLDPWWGWGTRKCEWGSCLLI